MLARVEKGDLIMGNDKRSMPNMPAILPPSTRPAPAGQRWLNRLFWLLVLCALALALLLFRAEILTALARAWIVDEPAGKADAILVLGGRVDYRPFAAAQLFRDGHAPLVLVTEPEPSLTAKLELTSPEHAVALAALLKEGVPVEAIRMVGTNVTSTLDEARAVRAWATERHLKSLLIPTDPFHTRRVRRIFTQTLRGSDVRVTVTAIPMKRYRADNWWRDEQGLTDFQSELAKYLYYLVH
jgi:uncharacterized SAM-binding protein YcdF (DUF218 family)